MPDFELKRINVIALHYNDTENGVHSIFDIEKGGPIIHDTSLDAAKYKFENALKLASAVRNLLYFGEVTKTKTPKKLRLPVNNIADVTYQEMVA